MPDLNADADPSALTDGDHEIDGSTETSGPAKEFRIVVRSQDRRGPLAPYRLTIAVVVVALVLGPALWAGFTAGTPDDGVLIRAALMGMVVWITTGIVSAALADAGARSDPKPPRS